MDGKWVHRCCWKSVSNVSKQAENEAPALLTILWPRQSWGCWRARTITPEATLEKTADPALQRSGGMRSCLATTSPTEKELHQYMCSTSLITKKNFIRDVLILERKVTSTWLPPPLPQCNCNNNNYVFLVMILCDLIPIICAEKLIWIELYITRSSAH